MRYFRPAMVALGALALISAPALAQPQGGGGRGGMGMMGRMTGLRVLGAPTVHQELGLSEDQIEKVEALSAQLRQDMMAKGQEFRELPAEERTAKMGELLSAIDKEIQTKVSEIFEPKQAERFGQIHLQAQGLQGFLSPAAEKLALTDDQKAGVKSEIEKLETLQREAFQSGGGGQGGAQGGGGQEAMRAAFEKITAASKEALATVKDSLTDEQKKTWEELTGKPFELPAFGGGRGGPGGPGGRGPAGARPASPQ